MKCYTYIYMPGEQKKKILVVEDEAIMADLLQTTLQDAGFFVLRAANGTDALSMALGNKPDMILLDIMIPGIDGLAVLQKLRENEWGKHVPVIMLTNLSPDTRILESVTRDEPLYYVVKSNTSMEDIANKVKEGLIRQ